MVSRVRTVAFQGIEAVPVDVQVMIAPGKAGMQIVGLPDKAVAESRERVQAALHASGLSMPAKKVTVNLAPADLPKEGSHYDLPIALGLMEGLGAIPGDVLSDYVVLGELSLDGTIAQVAGALPAAIGANALGKDLICPHGSGPEAAWAGPDFDIVAPRSLIAIANHFRGTQVLSRPEASIHSPACDLPDLADIKGQESAKRALEVAAGGHNLLMVGPPGSGKSMLAQRLPSILPPLVPKELLEVSMVASIAGELGGGKLTDRRPFRAPHHSASMAAMVGGGLRIRPGEVSLAHHGVLFLDEFPEFSPAALDSLRQPLEAGECIIARANHRVTYPARIQLVAAMNPCRCGMAGEPGYRCARAALPIRLSGANFRAVAGPNRSPYRGSRSVRVRSDPSGEGGIKCGGGRARRTRQVDAAGAFRTARLSVSDHQRALRDRAGRGSRRRMPRACRFCETPARRWGFRRALITVFSRLHARSPTSMVSKPSAASTLPKRFPTA
jgi:magnesium chelatase family protein